MLGDWPAIVDGTDDSGAVSPRLAPLMSSANPNWQTPPEFLDVVRKMGPIGLDPCTTMDNPVGADIFMFPPPGGMTAGIDGLAAGWGGGKFGVVFCNPPYGRGLGAWSAKMKDEAKRGAEIIGLLPARTDTKWWQDVTSADAVCFWRGRLKFVGAPHAAPFPSAVPYWGPRAVEFRRIFSQYGWVVFSRQAELFSARLTGL